MHTVRCAVRSRKNKKQRSIYGSFGNRTRFCRRELGQRHYVVIGGILIYLANQKGYGTHSSFADGLRRDHREPAGFRNCGGRRNHPHSLRLRHCKRIFPAGAFHRHRCNDRLRPRADQPETYAFRCGGAVRHFFHALHGNPLRVRADGIRFHCDNRRGGRPDKHCCCKPPRHQRKQSRGFSVRSLLRHIPIWLLFRLYSDP